MSDPAEPPLVVHIAESPSQRSDSEDAAHVSDVTLSHTSQIDPSPLLSHTSLPSSTSPLSTLDQFSSSSDLTTSLSPVITSLPSLISQPTAPLHASTNTPSSDALLQLNPSTLSSQSNIDSTVVPMSPPTVSLSPVSQPSTASTLSTLLSDSLPTASLSSSCLSSQASPSTSSFSIASSLSPETTTTFHSIESVASTTEDVPGAVIVTALTTTSTTSPLTTAAATTATTTPTTTTTATLPTIDTTPVATLTTTTADSTSTITLDGVLSTTVADSDASLTTAADGVESATTALTTATTATVSAAATPTTTNAVATAMNDIPILTATTATTAGTTVVVTSTDLTTTTILTTATPTATVDTTLTSTTATTATAPPIAPDGVSSATVALTTTTDTAAANAPSATTTTVTTDDTTNITLTILAAPTSIAATTDDVPSATVAITDTLTSTTTTASTTSTTVTPADTAVSSTATATTATPTTLTTTTTTAIDATPIARTTDVADPPLTSTVAPLTPIATTVVDTTNTAAIPTPTTATTASTTTIATTTTTLAATTTTTTTTTIIDGPIASIDTPAPTTKGKTKQAQLEQKKKGGGSQAKEEKQQAQAKTKPVVTVSGEGKSEEQDEEKDTDDFVFVRAVPVEPPLSKEALARERLEHSIQKNKAKQLGTSVIPHSAESNEAETDTTKIDLVISELIQVYHALEPELIPALLDSTSGKFTSVLKTELDALCPVAGVSFEVNATGVVCPVHVLAGTPVFFLPAEGVEIESITICQHDWTVSTVQCVFVPSVFGAYEVKIVYHSSSSKVKSTRKPTSVFVSANMLVESEVYQLAEALDNLYDTLYWGFERVWTPALEGAICDLMVSVDEDLKQVMQSFGQQMQMFAMGNSMDHLMEMIQEDMTKSLAEQDFPAVGRLHQTLHSFLELTKMYTFPPALMTTIRNFETAKVTGQKSLQAALLALDTAVSRHATQIMAPSGDSYLSHLASIKISCMKVLSSFDSSADLSPIWGLKASQTMYHMMNSLGGSKLSSARIAFWPVLPLDKVIARQVSADVNLHTEILTGEVMMVGSLLNFKLDSNVDNNILVLTGLLHAGLGYVTSTEGTLVALHGTRRAAFHLTANPVHRKLASRFRDVSRVLRNGKKPESLFQHKLSLRVNTDFNQALAKLRLHHKQSWVNDALEATWRVMYARLQLIVVELWYGDTMIAADFGHPGRAGTFYVATRFFEQEHKKFQPGFLLALVELKVLRDIYGFSLWDLGNTDSNPMMSYKEDLTDIMTRPRFVKLFNKLCETNPGFISRLRSGILVPNIQEHHLFKANAS